MRSSVDNITLLYITERALCELAGDNNKKFTAVANSLLNISKVKSFFIKNLITNYVCML